MNCHLTRSLIMLGLGVVLFAPFAILNAQESDNSAAITVDGVYSLVSLSYRDGVLAPPDYDATMILHQRSFSRIYSRQIDRFQTDGTPSFLADGGRFEIDGSTIRLTVNLASTDILEGSVLEHTVAVADDGRRLTVTSDAWVEIWQRVE